MLRWVGQHDPSEYMLCVYEWGIWESSEDMALYSRWREGLGDRLTLNESQGRLALRFEQVDIASLGSLAISFRRGFDLAGSDGLRVVRVNHDGHLWTAAVDEDQLKLGLDDFRKRGDRRDAFVTLRCADSHRGDFEALIPS